MIKPIIALLVLSLNANAANTCPDGSTFIKEHITSSGVFVKGHCRKIPRKLTDAEKAARVSKAKAAHPGVAVSGGSK